MMILKYIWKVQSVKFSSSSATKAKVFFMSNTDIHNLLVEKRNFALFDGALD